MSVLLMTETNWLESIVLAQDSASVYLMSLARTGQIEIAVPEYSFHEADGSLNRKLIKRACRIDEALSLLGRIWQTEHYRELCGSGKEVLKELKNSMLCDRSEIKMALDEIKSMVRIIPYTSDASARAEMRFESANPPFKEGDCRIYESILLFVEQIGEKYDSIMFYTEDREDFNHPEIRDELLGLSVEMLFDSGMCVRRVMDF